MKIEELEKIKAREKKKIAFLENLKIGERTFATALVLFFGGYLLGIPMMEGERDIRKWKDVTERIKAEQIYKAKINSAFYFGCGTAQDSVNRLYDAGLEEFISVDYNEIPFSLKEKYVQESNNP